MNIRSRSCVAICKRSPLVIGDALPIAVRNGNPLASKIRGAVTREEIDHHVCRTLYLARVAERVKLVVLAGHLEGARGAKSARENLTYASTSYRRQIRELSSDISVIDIPFLSNQNSEKLKLALNRQGTPQLLKYIFKEFFGLSDEPML